MNPIHDQLNTYLSLTSLEWQSPFGRLFDEDIFELFTSNLLLIQQDLLVEKLQKPVFQEEMIPNRQSIFDEALNWWKGLSGEVLTQETRRVFERFFEERPFEQLLVILGMRFTPASLKTVEALPPTRQALLQAAFAPFNSQVSHATRAWEKHVGRSSDNFWGEVKGNPAQKEAFSHQKLTQILEQATWWNTFVHYKHDIVYEFRVSSGHGARWKKEGIEFLGFLEPFLEEEYQVGT